MGYARAVSGTTNLFSAPVTATGAGSGQTNIADYKTYQASGTTSAGAGSATVVIEGSNNDVNWDTVGTIVLTLGITTTSGSFTSNDRYRKIRANVTNLSGTGATVMATVAW